MIRSAAILTLAYAALFSLGSAWAADAEQGRAAYVKFCLSCHGEAGLGDGPVGLALPPDQKPANLQEGKFKFATDDAKLKELIQKGGAAVGLNPLMPPQAMTDAELASLIGYVHSLKK